MSVKKKDNHSLPGLLITIALILCNNLYAHNINYALANAPGTEIAYYYTRLGFIHIIPAGADHILFVVGLCLLSTKFKTLLWQATAFTVAHSITLALSMKNVIVMSGNYVEPIIAMSILFIAVENMFLSELKAWRIFIVFLFGLIHGMGFASVLNEIGLPPNRFLSSLFYFNLGVELGQIAVILAVFLLLILPFRQKQWYKKAIVYPLSAVIALIALYWTIERMA